MTSFNVIILNLLSLIEFFFFYWEYHFSLKYRFLINNYIEENLELCIVYNYYESNLSNFKRFYKHLMLLRRFIASLYDEMHVIIKFLWFFVHRFNKKLCHKLFNGCVHRWVNVKGLDLEYEKINTWIIISITYPNRVKNLI